MMAQSIKGTMQLSQENHKVSGYLRVLFMEENVKSVPSPKEFQFSLTPWVEIKQKNVEGRGESVGRHGSCRYFKSWGQSKAGLLSFVKLWETSFYFFKGATTSKASMYLADSWCPTKVKSHLCLFLWWSAIYLLLKLLLYHIYWASALFPGLC